MNSFWYLTCGICLISRFLSHRSENPDTGVQRIPRDESVPETRHFSGAGRLGRQRTAMQTSERHSRGGALKLPWRHERRGTRGGEGSLGTDPKLFLLSSDTALCPAQPGADLLPRQEDAGPHRRFQWWAWAWKPATVSGPSASLQGRDEAAARANKGRKYTALCKQEICRV